MCLNANAPCQDPVSPGVWWRDDADWKQYGAAQAAAILKGIADGAVKVDLGTVVSSKYSGGVVYVVDLSTMKQINLASGYIRDVKVVQAPPPTPATSPAADDQHASIKDELRACQKSMRSLKNMVLRLESDLLAVRLHLLDKKAKRVAATVATANQASDCSTSRSSSSRMSLDPGCERCSAGDFWEYLSEDDF